MNALNEDSLNMQIRKFLKKVGINSQREIETAVREAAEGGRLPADGRVALQMRLTIDSLGVSRVVEGVIEIE